MVIADRCTFPHASGLAKGVVVAREFARYVPRQRSVRRSTVWLRHPCRLLHHRYLEFHADLVLTGRQGLFNVPLAAFGLIGPHGCAIGRLFRQRSRGYEALEFGPFCAQTKRFIQGFKQADARETSTKQIQLSTPVGRRRAFLFFVHVCASAGGIPVGAKRIPLFDRPTYHR
jgi:hypothetical protein